MSVVKHAMKEFRAAGWCDENFKFHDEMQKAICDHLVELLGVFQNEGHSGSTAPYTVELFKKLALYEPIAPLTGEDWEWNEVGFDGDNGGTLYQNNRCGHVFKNDNGAYDIDGYVFWNWVERELEPDEPGYPGVHKFKSYYTCRDSHKPVTFPYTPTSEYVEGTYDD